MWEKITPAISDTLLPGTKCIVKADSQKTLKMHMLSLTELHFSHTKCMANCDTEVDNLILL